MSTETPTVKATSTSLPQPTNELESSSLQTQPTWIAIPTSTIGSYHGPPILPLENAPNPMTLETSPQEIRERMLDPFWETMWVRGTVVVNTPLGKTARSYVQAWIGRDGQGQVLATDYTFDVFSFSDEQPVRFLWVSDRQSSRVYDLLKNTSEPHLTQWQLHPLEMAGPMLEMIFQKGPGVYQDPELLDAQKIAGRDTLMVKRGESGIYWVDVTTGLTLRSQSYRGENREILQTEVIVDTILYNVILPEETRLGYLSRNSSKSLADNVFFDRGPAPEDFNPTKSVLRFKPAMVAKPDAEEVDTEFIVDIYADAYFLGSVLSGEAPLNGCTRSPNGEKIVFNYIQADGGWLQWFRLNDLNTQFDIEPQVTGYALAWSPDSRHLAFSGCGRNECGLFVLDSESRKLIYQNPNYTSLWWIIWGPDGRTIAFPDTSQQGENDKVVPLWVVDVFGGQVIDESVFDLDTWQPAAESIINSWGVDYPREWENYGNCEVPAK